MASVLAFLLTIVFALVQRWEARDLIWGLWISSLAVGYAFIIRIIAAQVVQGAKTVHWVLSAIGGLFFLLFFTFHFVGFHLIHSVFLSLFFPLIPMDKHNFPNIEACLRISVTQYWPVILANFIMKAPDFLNVSFEGKTPKDFFSLPYSSVVKIHLLIFVFAGMSAFHVSRYAMYPILLFFFFPWDLLNSKKTQEAR